MLLPVRASQPPWPLLRLPWAHTSAVDRIEVVSVGALPKIGCRSSIGIRNLPIVNRPQLDALPVSAEMFDSIWKIAFRPPPRLSVPRTPRREELLLTRTTDGLVA